MLNININKVENTHPSSVCVSRHLPPLLRGKTSYKVVSLKIANPLLSPLCNKGESGAERRREGDKVNVYHIIIVGFSGK